MGVSVFECINANGNLTTHSFSALEGWNPLYSVTVAGEAYSYMILN